jgi:hypothetical protein
MPRFVFTKEHLVVLREDASARVDGVRLLIEGQVESPTQPRALRGVRLNRAPFANQHVAVAREGDPATPNSVSCQLRIEHGRIALQTVANHPVKGAVSIPKPSCAVDASVSAQYHVNRPD